MNILVAGIGNIFMGDDGFGCAVAERLLRQTPPDGVDIADFGIRGLDLSYALTDGYDAAILVDTVARGGDPGTLYVIEPQVPVAGSESDFNPHGLDPASVLDMVEQLGGGCPRVLLVGCEPASLGGEDGHMGLSDTVSAAIDAAAVEVRQIIAAWQGSERPRMSA